MADHSTVMSQPDISALKDTLFAQQQLLQKLYHELDAEREASASAASEALSVILRLQAEKAAIRMEAEQYKRLSEEKMSHAEESLAIVEDIIYQKEMEAAALDYQVQAYRCKLLSMGCGDLRLGDINLPENTLPRNENVSGEACLQSTQRRNPASLPFECSNAISERDGSTSPERELISEVVEEQTGQELYGQASDSERIYSFTRGGINSYWEHIRKLVLQVKERAGANHTDSMSDAMLPSLLSSISLGDPYKQGIVNVTDHMKHPNSGVAIDNPCSANVHDVFEVPEVDQDLSTRGFMAKCVDEADSQGNGSLEREIVHPEAIEVLNAKDETDGLKNVLQFAQRERNKCRPCDIAAIDCKFAIVQPLAGVPESFPRVNQFNGASEITELESPEESNNNREEEFKLLTEIKEQLHSLADEVRSWKAKKSPTRDERSLREAMLYFWL